MNSVRVVDTDARTIEEHGLCGCKGPSHEGRSRKLAWLRQRFAEGLRYKVLRSDDDRDLGMIEYMPGEHAWRPIEAPGYLVVHCIMVHSKSHQKQGYGRMLLQACLDDAEESGALGVAAVTSLGTWMACSNVFLSNGFEVVDSAPPSFELVVKKLRAAPDPRLVGGWQERAREFGDGVTLVRCDQCPYTARPTREIVEAAAKRGIAARVVEILNAEQARQAPSAYGIFNVILDGTVVADHPISRRRFTNILDSAGR